ncbi:electron transfer flavoprotein subunit alpha/FixB family protein [Vibrio sp. TRT 21S02]|uniref:electron transfer flavoprotein subunit alpha/FixB family protein n=1 Tax=Vibrio sp. TRT 21S02 TaxID=3418507 RepID=UPI003CF1128E
MEEINQAVLVVAEHDHQTLSTDTLCTLNAAKQIGFAVSLLVIGCDCENVTKQASQIEGICQVLFVENEVYQPQLAENLSQLVSELGKTYSHILAAATTTGKNLLPRVAAMLDVGQLSDVIAIESPDTVVRPIYAGNALAQVQSNDVIKVITVRSSAFDAEKITDNSVCAIQRLEPVFPNALSTLVSQEKVASERPELPAAKVVVSGGRGLGSKENFVMVEQLADKLGGAIGASRAAVDAGFVSNDLQVGQTGKIVAPELYIAVGISGAIQHLAGMKDSKVIVAINSDLDAPIFQVADYGLVGDLFDILPELIEAI